jgi:hypothetical protein
MQAKKIRELGDDELRQKRSDLTTVLGERARAAQGAK